VSLDIYPSPRQVRGRTFTILRTADFDTIVQSSPSRIETRIAQAYNPTWHWTFLYDYLKNNPNDISPSLAYTDLQTLQGFYLKQQGQFGEFLLNDSDDNTVGPGLLPDGTPNLQAQLQLVQDSATGIWYSPIQRNMGGLFYEDLTDLQPGGATFFDNGVAKTLGVDYNIGGPGLAIFGNSFYGIYVQWTGTPTGPITAQFNFYFRVRFETDKQDFEKFMKLLWTIGGSEGKNGSGMLKLVSARTSTI
jgi:hypothetical protein